jgi:hypothetical protein
MFHSVRFLLSGKERLGLISYCACRAFLGWFGLSLCSWLIQIVSTILKFRQGRTGV